MTTCGTGSITIDDSILDDISEINKIEKSSTTVLEIKAREPYFHLEFSKSQARIYITDDSDMKAKGLFSAVDAILRKRGKTLRILFSKFAIAMFFLTFWVFSIRTHIRRPINFFTFQPGIVILLCYVLVWLSAWRLAFEKKSLIFLEHSSKAGWLKRNKDSLIVVIIGAVITVALTALIPM